MRYGVLYMLSGRSRDGVRDAREAGEVLYMMWDVRLGGCIDVRYEIADDCARGWVKRWM